MIVYPPPSHYYTPQQWELIIFYLRVLGHDLFAARIERRIFNSSNTECPGVTMDSYDDYDLIDKLATKTGLKKKVSKQYLIDFLDFITINGPRPHIVTNSTFIDKSRQEILNIINEKLNKISKEEGQRIIKLWLETDQKEVIEY